MSKSPDKLIYTISKDGVPKHEFYHHPIRGDGNCFINCYLDSFSSQYRSVADTLLGTKIGSKMRLEFAKFLISPSSRTDIDICLRLNIKNAGSLFSHLFRNRRGDSCTFLRDEIGQAVTDKNGNAINLINNITNEYIDFDGDSTSEIMQKIVELDLLIFDSEKPLEEWEPLDEDKIIEFFVRDPRFNLYENNKIIACGSLSQDHIEEEFRIKLEDYGIDQFPINIGYYEITEEILSDINMFKETLDILIDCDKSNIRYLQHEQSTLFAIFIGLNLKFLPIGNHYLGVGQFGKNKVGLPIMIFINFHNVHWEIVTLKDGSSINGRVFTIGDKTIENIYKRITLIYDK